MLINRRSNLLEHIVQFCQFLRTHQFLCGVQEEKEFLLAIKAVFPSSKEDFYMLSKAILTKKIRENNRYKELYDQYWKELQKAVDSKESRKKESVNNKQKKPPSFRELKDWLYNGRASDEESISAFSSVKAFSEKDFSVYSGAEEKEIMALLRQWAKHMAVTSQRRWKRTSSHKMLDLRQTLRYSARSGLSGIELKWKNKKPRKRKIVVVCDFSKSMELYTRFFLQFIYGFHHISARVESFGFGTTLQRISMAFNNADFNSSMERLKDYAEEWSGGTNIGSSLQELHSDYRYTVDRSTHVVIVSDGWDTGESESLTIAMKNLRRRSKQIIWVNPLASNPSYEPRTSGMMAAMPYIDHFTSAHNLASLIRLVHFFK